MDPKINFKNTKEKEEDVQKIMNAVEEGLILENTIGEKGKGTIVGTDSKDNFEEKEYFKKDNKTGSKEENLVKTRDIIEQDLDPIVRNIRLKIDEKEIELFMLEEEYKKIEKDVNFGGNSLEEFAQKVTDENREDISNNMSYIRATEEKKKNLEKEITNKKSEIQNLKNKLNG